MPTINLRVDIQNETQLGNVLRAIGVLDLKSSAATSVFRLEHLVEGKTHARPRNPYHQETQPPPQGAHVY